MSARKTTDHSGAPALPASLVAGRLAHEKRGRSPTIKDLGVSAQVKAKVDCLDGQVMIMRGGVFTPSQA